MIPVGWNKPTLVLLQFVLKREMTPARLLGVSLIAASLAAAKMEDVLGGGGGGAVPAAAVLMALAASCNSTVAAVCTEWLFKQQNGGSVLETVLEDGAETLLKKIGAQLLNRQLLKPLTNSTAA